MKSNYHERKEARIAAFENLAIKNAQTSKSLWASSSKMLSVIPMGQPILVGHHSEGSHRSLLARADNAMRKGCEADKKADYYANKAESAASNNAISSDNPDAIQLLKDKLEKLEKDQVLMVSINKIVKSKKLADIEKMEKLTALGLKESTAAMLVEPQASKWDIGIPSYKLTNNSAVIRSTKERIQHLEKIASLKEETIEKNGVVLKLVPDDNRVKFIFPGKPSESIRTELKRSGFHWAPSEGAWMRQISNGAVYAAREILKKLETSLVGFP